MSAVAAQETVAAGLRTTVGAPQAGGRRNAAILASELRGLARMSEALEARLVLVLAGEFFNFVGDIVAAHGGEAVSAQHDSLLSVFCRGNPLQAAQQAVRAAQRVQADFPAMAEQWRTAYGLRSAVAQGLHLGEVILGNAGLRGAEQRTAFGDAVTLAQQLRHRSRAGEFVMSDSVMGALSVENLDLDAEPLPPLELPRRNPIRLYGVLVSDRLDFT